MVTWEVNPEVGLVVGGRRLLELVVAGRPGGHRRGRYGAHVLRLHLEIRASVDFSEDCSQNIFSDHA